MVGAATRRGGTWLVLAALLGMATGCGSVGPSRAALDLTASSRGLTVQRVVDGDTVVLSDGRRVRLLGIDTPETVEPNEPVECWGPEATAFARATLQGVPVTATGDPTQVTVDKFGRTLAYLTLADGRDYSVLAAAAGAARAYTYDRPVQKASQIAGAEAEARAAGRGLWGAGCSTPATRSVVAAQVPGPAAARPVRTTASTPTPDPVPSKRAQTRQPATTRKTTTKAASGASGGCDPNYSGCVPVASDVDCAGGSGNGPAYVRGPVRVTGRDVYGLDADKDGVGCE